MSHLSKEQQEKFNKIQKNATMWGGIVGLVVGLLAFWMLGSYGGLIRTIGALVIGVVVAGVMFKKSMSSGAKDAKCPKCNANFSVDLTDTKETLRGSEAKEERDEKDDGSIEIKTWTEETYDVEKTYTCSSCGDVAVKNSETTKRKDEKTDTIPAKSAGVSKGKTGAKNPGTGTRIGGGKGSQRKE